MSNYSNLKERRKEYKEFQDEIIDEEEDYFDVNKQDNFFAKSNKKYNFKRYNKENPYG